MGIFESTNYCMASNFKAGRRGYLVSNPVTNTEKKSMLSSLDSIQKKPLKTMKKKYYITTNVKTCIVTVASFALICSSAELRKSIHRAQQLCGYR